MSDRLESTIMQMEAKPDVNYQDGFIANSIDAVKHLVIGAAIASAGLSVICLVCYVTGYSLPG